MSMREEAEALRIDLRHACVMGSRVLGLDADGQLYQWSSDRWGRLILVDQGPRSQVRPRNLRGRFKRKAQR